MRQLTDELDPLIYGPQPGILERVIQRPQVIAANAFDLEATSPFYDFYKMCQSPRIFFKALDQLPSDFSSWVWIKSILLAVLGIWVHNFQSQMKLYESVSDRLMSAVGPQTMSYIEYKAGVIHLGEKLKVLSFLFSQFQAVSAPVFALSSLVVGAGFLILGLRFVGVSWEKISFPKIFLLGIYLEFFYCLAIVPVMGSTLVAVCRTLYAVLAVSAIFEISKWKAVKAYFIVSFVVAELLVLLALVPLALILKMF